MRRFIISDFIVVIIRVKLLRTVSLVERLHKLRIDDESLSLVGLLLALGLSLHLHLAAVHLKGRVSGVHAGLGLTSQDLVRDALSVRVHALLDLASLGGITRDGGVCYYYH